MTAQICRASRATCCLQWHTNETHSYFEERAFNILHTFAWPHHNKLGIFNKVLAMATHVFTPASARSTVILSPPNVCQAQEGHKIFYINTLLFICIYMFSTEKQSCGLNMIGCNVFIRVIQLNYVILQSNNSHRKDGYHNTWMYCE